MYFDQSWRAFCAGCGQYGNFILIIRSRQLTYRHFQCVVFARHCAGVIYGLSALALVVSCPPTSQSPRKMPAGVLDFSGQNSGRNREPRLPLSPACQRARELSEGRHVETKYQHRAHRILHHPSLHPRHFTSHNTTIPSGLAVPLTRFAPYRRRAERRLSGLRQGVL